MDTTTPPTVPELLSRMDVGWAAFRQRVHAARVEQLDERIGESGWTRKQMLAHVATWHELTAERLVALMLTGEATGIDEHEDVINSRAARGATGRTTGEVVQSVEDSYGRLRRAVGRLTEEQLAAHGWFAAAIVRGNSFGHYGEHLADLP